MFKFNNNLLRKEKRLLWKLGSSGIYKLILGFIFAIFWLKKKFLVFWNKWSKKIWLISITSSYFFWRKIYYIDDFIVNKKLRGKWVWKWLFTNILKDTKWKKKSDYIFLLSKKNRKKSHSIYRKFGFSLISLWIWYIAYKKIKK